MHEIQKRSDPLKKMDYVQTCLQGDQLRQLVESLLASGSGTHARAVDSTTAAADLEQAVGAATHELSDENDALREAVVAGNEKLRDAEKHADQLQRENQVSTHGACFVDVSIAH